MMAHIVSLVPEEKMWLVSVSLFSICLLISLFWDKYVVHILKSLVKKTDTKVDDYILAAINVPIKYVMVSIGISLMLRFSPYAELEWINKIFQIVNYFIVFCILWTIFRLADYTENSDTEFVDPEDDKDSFIHYLLKRTDMEHDEAIANILSAVTRIATCVIGFGVFCDALGVNVSAFIASLSIGTAAVAFAAKDIFSNIFSTMTLLLDKTFKKGDWIVSGTLEGIVEEITLRSICIRTFSGDLVYVPSAIVVNGAVINRSRGEMNRIDLMIKVALETSVDKLEVVVNDIIECLHQNALLKQEYADIRVYLKETTELSHNIRILCFTEYRNFLDQKIYSLIINEINISIVDILRKHDVKMVFEKKDIKKEDYHAGSLPQIL